MVQRKRAVPHSTMKTHHNMMSVLVTALSYQPEAFASELVEDQSHYLLYMVLSHTKPDLWLPLL